MPVTFLAYSKKNNKIVEIQNPRIVLYTGVLVDENGTYNLAIYSACLQQESWPILVLIFLNRIFFVNTQQESIDFGRLFLGGGRTAVRSR